MFICITLHSLTCFLDTETFIQLCKLINSFLIFSLMELSPTILKRDDYVTLGIQQESLVLGL